MSTTTFKTRFRTLFAMELAALWRDDARRFMLLLPILGAVVSPSFALFFTVTFLGLSDLTDLGILQSSRAEFLLSKAMSRHEAFLAKASCALTLGVLVVIWALAWPGRSPAGFPTWDVGNELVAFPYFLLLFLTYWFARIVLAMILRGHPQAVFLLLLCCGMPTMIAAEFWWHHCRTEGRDGALAVTYLCMSAVLVLLAWISVSSFSRLEPGVATGGRFYNRLQSFLAAMSERRRQQDGAKGGLALETERALPVRALLWLVWLGLIRWARFPFMLLAVLGYSLFLVSAFGASLFPFFLLYTPVFLVPLDIRLGGYLSTQRFPVEFVRSLPVSKRLHFRTQIGTSFPMLLVLLSACVLLAPLGSLSDTAIALTDRAAQAVAADPMDDSDDDHLQDFGFLLVPRGTFAERTVHAGRKAHVLTRVCLVMVAYLAAWLAFAPGIMGGGTRWRESTAKDKVRALVSALFSIAVFAFLFCGGPLVARVFVLAYNHPGYMILGTLSICAVLFRLAERQFVNIEVIA